MDSASGGCATVSKSACLWKRSAWHVGDDEDDDGDGDDDDDDAGGC